MTLIKTFAGVVGAASFFAIVALAISTSGRLPAKEVAGQDPECEGCHYEKLFWAPVGDPGIDNANRAAIQATIKADRDFRLKKARDERLREMENWQGTELVPALEATESQKSLYQGLAVHLKGAATPESRNVDFAWCSQNGLKLVGWFGVMLSAAESENGWDVVIQVRPKLMHADHAIVYSFQASTETWWIPKNGEPKLAVSDPGRDTGPNTVQFN